MKNSPACLGARPNWYRGLLPRREIDYFGSTASRAPGQVYVTPDQRFIVTRDDAGRFSVMQNVCAHAGAQILTEAGVQQDARIQCPLHRWTYAKDGALVAAPHFCDYEGIRLARPEFGVWNGYVLGYPQEDLAALGGFGSSFGLPEDFLAADHYVFGREIVYELPYPRALMAVNYMDGVHVQYAHVSTLDSVADSSTFAWELGPTDTACSYALQLVRARRDVAEHTARLMKMLGCRREDLTWSDLSLWLDEVMPDRVTPIDRDIAAIWAMVYPYVMYEVYLGGLFLVLAYLTTKPGTAGDPEQRHNLNPVEYYVHQSVPEALRAVALERFIHAYELASREDEGICLRLDAAHRRDDLELGRRYHPGFEAGDPHLREWFLSHYAGPERAPTP